MKNPFRWISEMFVVASRGMRVPYHTLRDAFFPNAPAYDKTHIDYDTARQLYRNDGGDSNLGGFFCRPIIDTSVQFIGLPHVSSGDVTVDGELNGAIQKSWAPKINEIYRNAMRDSKCVIRMWQPNLDIDPLSTVDEHEACLIEIYEPERVKIQYDPQYPGRIKQATIVTTVEFQTNASEVADAERGTTPMVEDHEVWEILTPTQITYYDKTEEQPLTDWGVSNPFGFVPLFEAYNEYDSSLSGGQSDLEAVYPLIKAFHEVMRQALQAHAYHSTPKLKFKAADIGSFLQNNFPNVINPDTGAVIPGSEISWKGREVLILSGEDDVGFIEAKSVLPDSKVLLDFLIGCISIASETPEWAFMRVENGSSEGSVNAQTIPLEKKIARKRQHLAQPFIQWLCKARQAIVGQEPVLVDLIWPEVRTETLATMSQAIAQLMTALDLALERHLISDDTARDVIRQFPTFRVMKDSSTEAKNAKDNYEITGSAVVTPVAGQKATTNGNGKVDQLPPISALNKNGG